MPYIPPSVVQEVKRMDLLTYLKIMNRMNWFIFPAIPTPPEHTTA